MKNLDKDIQKVLIDAVKIQERVCEMGAQITKDYEGRELVLVGVLKGAMPFLCDLMRAIDLPLTIDTMVVSSYGNDTVSSGSIHIRKDLDKEIESNLLTLNIEKGLYATFEISGKLGGVLPVIRWAYHEWLPKSGFETNTKPSFAIFHKNPIFDENNEFEATFYLPIQYT